MTADAGSVVLAYLADQRQVIRGREADVRVDVPDAVHRCRVATRRARSALRTYGPLFQSGPAGRLRDELAWHADLLGAPRDAEVLLAGLTAALDVLAAEHEIHGFIRFRLAADLQGEHEAAHGRLIESMNTGRYRRLRESLDAFVDEPSLRAVARRPAAEVLPGLLARTMRRIARLAERAREVPSDLTHWHEVRKAAKVARYCSEALVAEFGQPAGDLAAAWERVTEEFGAVQDTVVAEHVVARLACDAQRAGEPVDSYLALEARELRVREEALREGQEALVDALALAARWPGY